MATFTTETEHGGARLAIVVVENESAELLINGLVRESTGSPAVAKLTSTVQTDYEWHEFVEAYVRYFDDRIETMLISNKIELKHETFPRTAA